MTDREIPVGREMCRMANTIIAIGLLIAAAGTIFFLIALDSIQHETEGFVIIMPQIFGMIVGSILIAVGSFLRYQCRRQRLLRDRRP
jgi:glucose uptake protein GlcU